MKNLGQLLLVEESQETQTPNSEIELITDLLMEIFARVPTESVMRFRCLSKPWRSMLACPYFTELFLSMSWSRPRLLLFSFEVEGKIYFFSSPQPQNPDHNSSLVATAYHSYSLKAYLPWFGSPLHGFILVQNLAEEVTTVICNPVTGESVFLPMMESKYIDSPTRPYLGYDPVRKQHKVLCIKADRISWTHKILTLENGNHLWREIKSKCKPHYPKSAGLCVDGVLYYTAVTIKQSRQWKLSKIVCFDFSSEKFSFIKTKGSDTSFLSIYCVLINYKGKLGALQFNFSSRRSLELWFLQDAVKSKWSKTVYTLPSCLDVDHSRISIVGITREGEVVLSPHLCWSFPFYIYYFNLDTNSFNTVYIQGFEGLKPSSVDTSMGYTENLKLI